MTGQQETILVTGGAGYIGGHTVLRLLEAGRRLVILDDLSTGDRARIPEGVLLIEGSAGDERLVGQVLREHGVGAIMHFAGSLIAPESLTRPIAYYRNNTVNSLNLVAAAVAHGVRRFIFSSSAAVYAPAPPTPLSESAATGPSTPYGASKLMTEQILADVAAAHELDWLALRYFNVGGADPLGRMAPTIAGATHLIAVACQAALGLRDHLPINGVSYDTPDGSCVRDFIHVSDLAEAHWLGLLHLERGGGSGVFNCGYGRGVSVLEVLKTLEAIIGRPVPHEIAPPRPGDIPFVVADSTALREAFGWTPRHMDIRDIIEATYRAAKEQAEHSQGVKAELHHGQG